MELLLQDIAAARDIHRLVDTFYNIVRQDDLLGPVFNGKIGDDWSHHTPRIYAFWEAVLLGTSGYSGNAVLKHIGLDREYSLRDAHFERWLELWSATIDQLFSGEKATEAKEKARTMASLMMFKIGASRKPGFVS